MPFFQVFEGILKAQNTALGIPMILKRIHRHDVGLERLDAVQQKIGDDLVIGMLTQHQFEQQNAVDSSQRVVRDGDKRALFGKTLKIGLWNIKLNLVVL